MSDSGRDSSRVGEMLRIQAAGLRRMYPHLQAARQIPEVDVDVWAQKQLAHPDVILSKPRREHLQLCRRIEGVIGPLLDRMNADDNPWADDCEPGETDPLHKLPGEWTQSEVKVLTKSLENHGLQAYVHELQGESSAFPGEIVGPRDSKPRFEVYVIDPALCIVP